MNNIKELPKEYTDPITGIEFVLVEGGTFNMGSNNGYEDEKPIHEVELDSYYIARYATTQEQWIKVMQNNPSYFRDGDTSKYPVENVSWNDIVNDFLPAFKKLTGLDAELPTEAEWEYAARSGGKDEIYAGSNNVEEVAHCNKESVQAVGLLKPNGLGLYDMSGNVWEWCKDVYSSRFYNNSPKKNPVNRY